MCEVDLEPSSVWMETTQLSRKTKKCYICNWNIKPGDKQIKHFSVHDGNVTHSIHCLACEHVRNEFYDAHGQLMCPEYTAEMLHECMINGGSKLEEKTWRDALAGIRRRQRISKREDKVVM